MAISTLSNHFKAQLYGKQLDLDSDDIKIALVSGQFTFDKDAHATWPDVSSYELPAGVGYATGGLTLQGCVIAEDDSNDRARFTCNDARWNSSGELGPVIAAVIYDDDATDDTIIGCVEFGSDVTVNSGSALEVQNIIIDLS